MYLLDINVENPPKDWNAWYLKNSLFDMASRQEKLKEKILTINFQLTLSYFIHFKKVEQKYGIIDLIPSEII